MPSARPAEPDLAQLAREFTDEMYAGYRHLARAINYRARQFLEMVTMHGGDGAARRLLQGPDASDGFTRLWQANMLHYSVEAAVLKPKYERLFTEGEREIARRRLERHDFDVQGFLKQFD